MSPNICTISAIKHNLVRDIFLLFPFDVKHSEA